MSWFSFYPSLIPGVHEPRPWPSAPKPLWAAACAVFSMPPLCNPRKFLETHPRIPEKPGWTWAIGSVEYSQKEDRYRYCALVGPGYEILKSGQYGRALLDLHGIVVDVSVVRGEKRRICMVLPRELNHIWAPLYGGCHVAYIIPKRMFLMLTDQIVNEFMITHVYRKYISPKIRT
jgi:hypothetical protein